MLCFGAGQTSGLYVRPSHICISLTGEWDIFCKDELWALLRCAKDADVVILDMTETTFLDASSLGQLVRVKNVRIAREHPVVRLVGLLPQLKQLFSLTGLDSLFTIE